MRAPRFANLFEAFVNVVPFQQVSLDAGVAVVKRLVERFGGHLEYHGRRFYAFPTAQTIAGARLDALQRCGLSAQKAKTLRAIARAMEADELSEDQLAGMRTDEALAALVRLSGIGQWSASLVLLRGLGRLDVFPPRDVGATRGLGRLLRLDSESSLERLIARLGPQRGYFYFCCLGGSLLEKGLIHPARLEG
jgi:DNA-3-methyladenine glycosylase II